MSQTSPAPPADPPGTPDQPDPRDPPNPVAPEQVPPERVPPESGLDDLGTVGPPATALLDEAGSGTEPARPE